MVWVADDVFTIHHGWIREYAAEMKRAGIHIPFECISRADRLNAEIFDLLADWAASAFGSDQKAARSGFSIPWNAVSRLSKCRSRCACAGNAELKAGCFSCGAMKGRS